MKQSWRKRTKGTSRQKGKAFKVNGSKFRGSKKSKKYDPNAKCKVCGHPKGDHIRGYDNFKCGYIWFCIKCDKVCGGKP